MASHPGVLYTFPWARLGEFKYALLLPLAVHHFARGVSDLVQGRFDDHMLLIVALRYLQMACWQFAARYDGVSLKTRIQRKGIEFDQLDRERDWDDYILLQAVGTSLVHRFVASFRSAPVLDWWGVGCMVLTHIGPIEGLYYAFHRLLHHEFLWSRYHSHHHSSFVTDPVSGTVHPFMEQIGYHLLFSLAILVPWLCGHLSLALFYLYALGFDFLNAMGHCNFEFLPRIFLRFPLKYLIYTPTYHSLHHSKVHTNYCLFMPLYDHLFRTVCPATERAYVEAVGGGPRGGGGSTPPPLAAFLAHGGTLTHVFQMPFISKTVASEPYQERWYLWPVYPLLWGAVVPLLRLFGRPFKNADCVFRIGKGERVLLEQWGIPRFAYQYLSGPGEQRRIAQLIEDAVQQADERGLQVIGLGAFNKAEWLNGGGKDVVEHLPKLRVRVVHGNTLTAATVLHSVPPEAPEVLLVGCTSKVGGAVACALALRGVRVLMVTSAPERFEAVRARVAALDPEGQAADRLVMCTGLEDGQQCATWLAGKWLSAKDQRLIPAHGTVLYFCFPPPQPIRTDIAYINIGCLRVDPLRVEGLGNCTADLDRGVFHACHVGTIVHALEGWTHHEVGEVDMAAMEAAWEAAQRHGFRLTAPVARLLQGRPLSPRTSTSRSPSADALSASPTPTMTAAHVAQAAQDGQPLIIIEDWVHDVGEFLENHPGGAAILRKYYGRDATPAFNGERYNHSRAARAILARLRVAKLVTSVPKPRHPDADP